MNYILASGEATLHAATPTPFEGARLIVAQICDLDPASIDSSRALAEKLQGLAGAIITMAESQGEVELYPLGRAQRLAPQRTTALVGRFTDAANPHAWQIRMFLAHQTHNQGAAMSTHMVEGDGQWPLYDIVVPTDEQLDKLLAEEDPSTWRDEYTVGQDFRGDEPERTYPFHHELGRRYAPRHYFSILRRLSTDLLTATEK